ncbi:rhodanese-like domain-containing protein [Psittacicella hinzii]|uniref:Rhodanese domain-containing protein n=1 Tax=Psittacicella hinzii TaxID=2028575 RepID=A0A3A1YM23_9GAMM|nr:rhodanese-like domain-containing protein [Psittacicella hinzii]RIY38516.1 hypothetical protein CKF58_04135 [Psittacicella hinzii]
MSRLQQVKTISIQEVTKLLDENANICLFDMRTEDEYIAAHIPGAVHLTAENFHEEAEHFDENTMIIFYCYRGNASKVQALDLMAQGVENVYSMDGGITAWAKEGYQLVTG